MSNSSKCTRCGHTPAAAAVPGAYMDRFIKIMSEIALDLDGGNEWDDDPIPEELWQLYREATAPAPAEPAAVPDDVTKDELLDLLCTFFTLYEDGVPCYEDPESHDGFLGNALRLDDDDFQRMADMLNRHRPVAPTDPEIEG